jgi:hypothetical protein
MHPPGGPGVLDLNICEDSFLTADLAEENIKL